VLIKKLVVCRVTPVGAIAVALSSLAFLSTGVAADDYAGQTYDDALGAIRDAGKKVVISSRPATRPPATTALSPIRSPRRGARAITSPR
jgi:hypothetical protein